MKPIALATLLALSSLATGLLAGCSPPLTMHAELSPNPPQLGTETISIRLTDSSSKPVDGANVLISSAMPTMAMSGPNVQAHATGNGIYVASVKLAFATRWSFTITDHANDKTLTTTLVQNVK